jgi:hypothetical protein
VVLTWGLGAGLAMDYVGDTCWWESERFQIEVSVVGDFRGSNDRDFLQVSWSQGCGESSGWVWISD